MSGNAALPIQYSVDPMNAPCQSVSGMNAAAPTVDASHTPMRSGRRPKRSAARPIGMKLAAATTLPTPNTRPMSVGVAPRSLRNSGKSVPRRPNPMPQKIWAVVRVVASLLRPRTRAP
jgi:hypothetical protein